MADKAKPPIPAPVVIPPPSESPVPKKGPLQIVGDFWQLITAFVGIATAVVAGVSYFATRERLNQVECQSGNNLLSYIYSLQIDQLAAQIQIERMEVEKLEEDDPKAVREIRTKEADIAEKTLKKQDAGQKLDEIRIKILRGDCLKPDNKPPEKK